MCGISGFAGKGGTDDIHRMNDSIRHRGPDDEGFYQDEEKNIFLGFRRLSIVDITGGHQPMCSSDGNIVIIFNGEIYNHLEIRKELEQKGHSFKTDHSDTETLIYAYREWGKDFIHRLNGMWAFAIYDRNKNKLLLSRDRFGKKPLFYTCQNGTFAFTSELKSLCLHSNVQTRISKKGLKKYFAYGYIPAPGTIYENCFKLPGGHTLELNTDNLQFSIQKYWEFKIEPFENIPAHAEEKWGEELLSKLEGAVKRRLMSDVPLGFFLSGGIDSSAIVALASRHVKGNYLKTFSIGFNEASFDETSYSSLVAKIFNTDHHTETLSINNCLELLPEIVEKLDEPMGDSSLVPTFLLCRETRKHVTVAMGGDGADELFCGYDPFKAINLAKLYSSMVPKPVHQAIMAIAARIPVSHRNMSLDFKLKRTLRGLSYAPKFWGPVWLGPLPPNDINELFNEKTDMEDLYSEAISAWDSCAQKNYIDKTMEFYVKLYLQDDILVKVDRASMMNSLEVRCPFLDIDVVDFVRKIPHQYKYRNGQTKYILKKSLEKILPHDVLYRTKKGFGMPVGKWLKDGKLPVNNNGFEMLNKQFIDKQMTSHLNNKSDNRAFLWNLWLLTNWSSK